jgi:hypothetical protein
VQEVAIHTFHKGEPPSPVPHPRGYYDYFSTHQGSSQSPYAYVGDDPVDATDSSGRCGTFDLVCKAQAAAAAAAAAATQGYHWAQDNLVAPLE